MSATPRKLFALLTAIKVYLASRSRAARRYSMATCPSMRPTVSRVVMKNAMVSAAPAVSEISTQTGESRPTAEPKPHASLSLRR
jgi:hypothetical protein